ncbi:class I adenylate-forming enzyme family protein [Conexibacter sp. DBS9H8]|uniref:class I adenylate-forming enzyme family protein n=1 Tax=Conexibacter sp. DBS9H8 TaxID=2937801 RepID=UPI002010357D|nr:AMP-binding protein [Conexibacter sp. DBS9H8]
MTQGNRLAPAAERRERLQARYAPWIPMTLAQALDRAAAEFPERPLVITDERVYTYAEVQSWSERLAAGLIELGVGVGDHVALVMANHPEFVPIKFAIARAGATCIPINFLFQAAELGYVLRQSDAKVLITMDRHRDLDYLSHLDSLVPDWENAGFGSDFPQLRRIVVFSPERIPPSRETLSLEQLESLGRETSTVELRSRAATIDVSSYSDILYTSGTTGSPKGVLLKHDQVVRESYAAAYQRALEDGRRIAFPMPMYHVFGYMEGLMAALFVGGAIIPQVAFNASHMLKQISRHQVHEVMAVPAVALPLIAEHRRGGYDISTVQTVFASGGAAPPSVWDDIRDVFGPGVELITGYGMTETTATTTCTNPEDDEWFVRNTNGRLRAGGLAGDPELDYRVAAYKAVDVQTGADLAPGERGHLLVRGMVVTDGYYKKPEETALAFTQDGWLRTGDIGSIDADGILRLTGRLKESFRVGGEMVMPKEIENVLAEHPAVAEAHVVGIPHDRMGEVACAWVVPVDPDGPPVPEELVAHCQARLAGFKVPRSVIVAAIEELPVTATGRVQKFRLVELSVQRLSERIEA